MTDMTETSGITPEFSRTVPLADIEKHDVQAEWTATQAECKALTQRFGIVAVYALTGQVDVSRLGGGGALARITIVADVEQQSVVSLENVRQGVETRVVVRYLTDKKAREYERMIEAEGGEPPNEDIEVIGGESIDIGETIAQQLSLALDPYPRQAGELFEAAGISSDEDGRADRPNPFEVLKNFKQNS